MQAKTMPLILSIGVMLGATATWAQEPRLAERLVELMRIEQAMEVVQASILQGIEQGWMNRVERERQRLSEDQIGRMTNMLPEFQTIMEEEIRNFRSQILPSVKTRGAALYEERFSNDELKELVEVLERPSVQRLFDLQPEAGQIGTEIALQHTTAFQERIDQRVNELIERALQE